MSKADQEAITAYRAHMIAGGLSKRTVQVRMWQLRRLSEGLNCSLANATTDRLLSYAAGHDWSSATSYAFRATMRDFYAFMVTSGRVQRNPALGLPKIKVRNQTMLPAPESALRPEGVDPRVQLMVDLGAREGLRRAEIVAIHSRDLIPAGGHWSLIVHGKGGRERTVPLHDDIAARIKAHGKGWLFPSPSGGHLSPGWAGKLIADALGQGWTAHSLRRRFATQIYTQSHDLRAVQQLLGHTSLTTTQVYLGTRAEDLRDALRFS